MTPPATLLHGTTTAALATVGDDGHLTDVHLTDELAVAVYYAEQAAEDDGSAPVVVVVAVDGPARLRYDRAAMDEPVLTGGVRRDRAWAAAARQHPGWVERGMLLVPPDAWWVSLSGAASVRLAGPARIVGQVA